MDGGEGQDETRNVGSDENQDDGLGDRQRKASPNDEARQQCVIDLPDIVTGKSACYGPGGICLAENAGNEETLLIINI